MRACKLLHDLKKLFILMFFFFNYFFFHPLNNIVVSAYSVFIDLLDNVTFNILLPTFVANITFAHDSFEHETFLTLWSKITYNLRYVHFYMPLKPYFHFNCFLLCFSFHNSPQKFLTFISEKYLTMKSEMHSLLNFMNQTQIEVQHSFVTQLFTHNRLGASKMC